MNLILLSAFKCNFLRFVHAFLICVSVFFTASSAKDIYFLKGRPSSMSLKKILNIKCFSNISFRSNPVHLPDTVQRARITTFPVFIMTRGLVLKPGDRGVYRLAMLDSCVDWGKQKIWVVLDLWCCFVMSKTYSPNNEGGSVYELARPVWTLVPFPELCLYSLFWNAHL